MKKKPTSKSIKAVKAPVYIMLQHKVNKLNFVTIPTKQRFDAWRAEIDATSPALSAMWVIVGGEVLKQQADSSKIYTLADIR